MDWMDIATEYLASIDTHDFIQKRFTMQVYAYISCIDIVFDCVKKLHGHFIDKKSIPFNGDSSIFNDNRLHLDDNQFFKHIRAAFGAHPIDLNEKKEDGQKGRNKRYASWPTSRVYQENDYTVMLYSENQTDSDIPLGFRIEQLQEFFQKRYLYLKIIEDAIMQEKKHFENAMRTVLIQRNENILAQLKILKEENQVRLGNDYYKEIIEKLESFYETSFIEKSNYHYIYKYHCMLTKGVEELFDNVQNVTIKEISLYELLFPDPPLEGNFRYAFQTISEHSSGNYSKRILGLDAVTDFLEKPIIFNYETDNELYWLVVIGLNIKNQVLFI
jgi:hypothetical protein